VWALEASAGYITSLLRWRKQEAEQERELKEESA
jgi:ribosomal protein S17E